ncbi:hypothetical protein [Streptomyces sp. CT34]|uniref:hypothetical protein n=1 Tax=Streptomyces sp. CT34 TaxID=1553907 RepID=UPI0005BDF1E7|nr:hypothetical protein [Streptomyces sp. CT34]
MAYDEVRAERVRGLLEPDGVVAKKMFGTIVHLRQRKNTPACVAGDGLLLRVGRETSARRLRMRPPTATT